MARLAGRRAPRLRFSRRCVSTPFSSLPETLCSIPDRGKPGIETSDAAGVRAHPSVSGTVDCLPFLLYRGFLVPPLNVRVCRMLFGGCGSEVVCHGRFVNSCFFEDAVSTVRPPSCNLFQVRHRLIQRAITSRPASLREVSRSWSAASSSCWPR